MERTHAHKRYCNISLDADFVDAYRHELHRKNLSGFFNEVLGNLIRNARAMQLWYKCERCEVLWTKFAWEKNAMTCRGCGYKNNFSAMKELTQEQIKKFAEGGGGMSV
jgi:acetyl-CoA carboxylase beta subunit